jgi:hypothetical protein
MLVRDLHLSKNPKSSWPINLRAILNFWLDLWICWSLLKEVWYFWPSQALICHCQGRHGEFEPGKAQYSTPNFFDRLFLIRAYWNPKCRQGPGLGGLVKCGAPDCCRCFDWKRPTWDWILSFTNDVGKTNEIGNGNTITQNFITLGRQCKTWSRLKMMRSSRGPQVLCEPVYCTVWAR